MDGDIDWRAWRQFSSRVVVVIVLVALTLLLWRVANVLLLAFGSVVLAVLLRAGSVPLAKRTSLAEAWALAIVVVGAALILSLLVWLMGEQIRAQIAEFVARVPVAWNQVQDRLGIGGLRDWVSQAGTSLDPIGGVLSPVAAATTAVAGALGNFVLVLIGGLYLAADPETYRRGLLKIVPGDTTRDRIDGTLQASGTALRLWVLGQLVSMTIVGVLTGLGLWLVGVPAPLALGLLAFFATFIPYIGPVIAGVAATLVAAGQDWQTAFLAFLVYLGVQIVESYVVTPMVQQRMVDLPPVLTLFAVIALGVVLGPLGLVLGAPLLVVLFVAVKKLWVRETLGEATTLPA